MVLQQATCIWTDESTPSRASIQTHKNKQNFNKQGCWNQLYGKYAWVSLKQAPNDLNFDILNMSPKKQGYILNLQFQSVFDKASDYNIKLLKAKTGMKGCGIPEMKEINITQPGVLKLLNCLNPYKECGHHQPTHLNRAIRWHRSRSDSTLKSSLSSDKVPADWRTAFVTPIYKKGEQYDPSNYKPISLTSIVCKIMEHIIVNAMMQHFETHWILSKNHHGFRGVRSCEIQLLELYKRKVNKPRKWKANQCACHGLCSGVWSRQPQPTRPQTPTVWHKTIKRLNSSIGC